MRSSIDAVDLVFTDLDSSPVKAAISGKILKYNRTTDSNLEDIIINSLPVTNQKIQRGLINVNIHVPNLVLKIDGKEDRSTPNVPRLRTLSRLVLDLFQERWGASKDYLLEVERENIFPDGSNHFSNIRISFYSLQN